MSPESENQYRPWEELGITEVAYWKRQYIEARAALSEAKRQGLKEGLEKAAEIALGVTGPGNTVEQCHGYTAACCDIADAIRALEPQSTHSTNEAARRLREKD